MYLILFTILISITGQNLASFNKDELANEKPDSYDLKMALQDKYSAYALDTPDKDAIQPPNIDIVNKIDKLEQQTEKLAKLLGEDNMLPITSSKLWEIIYKYIMDHLEQFLKDNTIHIQIPMRYNFCMFIMPIMFTNYFLVFPAFYKFLIPPKIKELPMVKDFLASFDRFLNAIKKQSRKELLVTVHIKRSGSMKDDLEMIKLIPTYIASDPVKIIRWMIDFRVEANGFTPTLSSVGSSVGSALKADIPLLNGMM